jgi:hypothetical protein
VAPRLREGSALCRVMAELVDGGSSGEDGKVWRGSLGVTDDLDVQLRTCTASLEVM